MIIELNTPDMQKFRLFITTIALSLSFTAFSQIEKTYHQVIELGDAQNVKFNLKDDFTFQVWSGSNIMMEANITIDQGNVDVLNYVIKQGRYDLVIEKSNTGLTIKSKNERSAPLQLRTSTTSNEQVKLVIFIPEDYSVKNKTEILKKEPAVMVGNN
jgi:hypothetical protein